MGCDPERVTGYVDGELTRAEAEEALRHLSMCPACTAQARFEIDLGSFLRSLPDSLTGLWLTQDVSEAAASLSVQ
ncbi:MAG TPA: zf-HC2 domain-containing protein [Vicinamibacteria bacterium]